MLVGLPAGMAAGYGVAGALGEPAFIGLMLGALPAMLTSLLIADNGAARATIRSVVVYAPFIAALYLSMTLHPHRFLGLAALVPVLFAQFYAARFAPWGNDAGAVLFAGYLCGLLLPMPLTEFGPMAAIAAAGLAAATAARLALCRPAPAKALARIQRAFLACAADVTSAAADLLDAGAGTGPERERALRRLRRRQARLNEAALVADGLLAQPGTTGEAERLHRLLFETELVVQAVARAVRELDGHAPPGDLRRRVTGALRAHAMGGPGAEFDERAPRDLVGWLDRRRASGPPADVGTSSLVHHLAVLLTDLSRTSRTWVDAGRAAPGKGDGAPFQSPVVLSAGHAVLGSGPVAERILASGGAWRRLRVSPHLRTALQVAVAISIAVPVGDLISGRRFYWAAIGVMIIFTGTNTTYERVRKTGQRALGTVAGGALGIASFELLGAAHPWISLLLVVAGLTVGAYSIASHYTWWVIGLVVALVQLYAFTTGFHTSLILLRLAENMVGALTAVLVGLVLLPVGTRSMIDEAVRGHLSAVRDLVADAGAPPPDAADVRLSSASRAVDQALFRLNAVLRPIVRRPTGGSGHADAETLMTLTTVTGYAREIAAAAVAMPPEAERTLQAVTARMALSLEALIGAFAGETGGVWRRSVEAIDRLDQALVHDLDAVALRQRLQFLALADDALATLAEHRGMRVMGMEYAKVAPERRLQLASLRSRHRLATASRPPADPAPAAAGRAAASGAVSGL
ncbi:FUSC family protein [Actinomadura violacea]|uniref:FUSC family protein n=1 Tax=Actinomadura violacea TaxID=2819934 RepID=A0ABS3RQ58_9ACTN|nr:FUSC family protein [Actinomadura violacea]MBO2458879.1 FUSC family protein [Actinomadura violacea]